MSTYLSSLSAVPGAVIKHFRTLPEQIVGKDALIRVGAYTALTAAVTTIALYYLRPPAGSFKQEDIQKDPISKKVFVHLAFISQFSRFQACGIVKGPLATLLIGHFLGGIFKSQELWVPYLLNQIVFMSIIGPVASAVLNPLYTYASAEPAPLSPEAIQIERFQKLENEGRVQPQSDTSCAMVEFLAKLNSENDQPHLKFILNHAKHLQAYDTLTLIHEKLNPLNRTQSQNPQDQKDLLSMVEKFLSLTNEESLAQLDLISEVRPLFENWKERIKDPIELNSIFKFLNKDKDQLMIVKAETICNLFKCISKAVKAFFPNADQEEEVNAKKAKLVKEHYRSHFNEKYNKLVLEMAYMHLYSSPLVGWLLGKFEGLD